MTQRRIEITCPNCAGSGEDPLYYRECPECLGYGSWEEVVDRYPYPLREAPELDRLTVTEADPFGGLSGSRADASSRKSVSTKGFDPGRRKVA